MEPDIYFWQSLTQLLTTNPIIIDRPKGTAHPRYSDMIYPLDCSYLEHTMSGDGDGIDVWLGSLNANNNDCVETLTGILCTFDTLTTCRKDMYLLYIPNPTVDNDVSN